MIVSSPDFERLATALKRGKPDRVPIIEISVNRQVMEAFLGKRIESLADHIEPKAMDIVAIKRDWEHRFCVIGNIDLCYTLPRGTPKEVEEEVRLRIEQLAPGGGYVLSSANSIPEYVPLPNYVAMVQAARKYGAYGSG